MFPNTGFTLGNEAKYFLKYQCWESNGFSPQNMGKWWDYFFTSWEIFQHVIPNFGKCKGQEIPTLGKSWLKLGLRFPDAVFSLGKYAIYRFQDPNIGKPMGLFPKIWENNGAIFPQVGKYCSMLFPILENERDKKSPPWKRIWLNLDLSFLWLLYWVGKNTIILCKHYNVRVRPIIIFFYGKYWINFNPKTEKD